MRARDNGIFITFLLTEQSVSRSSSLTDGAGAGVVYGGKAATPDGRAWIFVMARSLPSCRINLPAAGDHLPVGVDNLYAPAWRIRIGADGGRAGRCAGAISVRPCGGAPRDSRIT